MAGAHLISTDRLADWACEHSAAGDLPWFVRRLARLTTGPEARIEFSTGRGIYGRDFDGIIEAEGIGKIPDGFSVWEVSTQSDYAGKAEDDYRKRTDGKGEINRAETTYVGVSLRHWPGRHDWVKAKAAEGVWKEVRFYDVDDLSEWLDQHSILGYQFSSKFGLASTAVRDLDEWSANWSKDCPIQLGNDWLLSGRDQEAAAFQESIQQARRSLWVTGAGMTDALAFTCAAIKGLPASIGDSIIARTLYVPNMAALAEVGATVRNAILIPIFGLETHQLGVVDRSNMILYCGHPAPTSGSIHLPRVRSMVLYERMTRDGIDSESALRASRAARNGVELMRKELGGTPHPFDLTSVDPSKFKALTAMLLINRWDSENDGDRSIVESLGGLNTSEFESFLMALGEAEVPIVRKSGSVWFLTDDGLAWDRCAQSVDAPTLDTYRSTASAVLTEDDPSFDLAPSDRWKAGLFGKRQSYSRQLKEGLSRTLAVLAGVAVPLGPYGLGQALVDAIVTTLLDDADARRWYALAPVLSLLAEGSPERFLRALEDDLRVAAPQSIRGLYATVEDPLTGGSRHFELLWALERLAWNRDYLLRTASCLARLHHLGFGTTTGNSPLASLREIFVPWHPSTEANLTERVAVFNDLRRRHPKASWDLLMLLLPKDHSTAHTTNRPQFRDWGEPPKPQPRTEIWKFNDEVIRWSVDDAGKDPKRLAGLVRAFTGYPDPWTSLLFERLREIESDIKKEDDRFEIWEAFRDRLWHHRRFSDAPWAMSAEQCQVCQSVMDIFEPSELARRYLWLFEQWVDLPEPGEDFDARHRRVDERREVVVKEIEASSGSEGTFRLAELAPESALVGKTVAIVAQWDGDSEVAMLEQNLGSDVRWRRNFAFGYASERYRSKGVSWILGKLRVASQLSWSPEKLADLLLCMRMNAETWAEVEKHDRVVQEIYWKQANLIWCDVADPQTLDSLITKMTAAGRELDLIAWLSMTSYHHDLEWRAPGTLRALSALAERSDPDTTGLHRLVHDVSRLLEILANSTVDQTKLAQLEFYFIPLVRFEHRPRAIGRALASDPSFFLELVKLVNKKKGEKKRTMSERESGLALAAHEVLDSWRDIPGDHEGTINPEDLRIWVETARNTARETGYLDGADISLGQLLANSPPGKDGIWPDEAICQIIEEAESRVLDDQIVVGRRNARGVTSRAPDAGGGLERIEEATYRRFASDRSIFLRTQRLLTSIADSYAFDAAREDRRAEMDQDLG